MAAYRSTYHHGDARKALIRAALTLARTGGPPAVTLRAAARDVGITATAVYRHFGAVEELLAVAKQEAVAVLAARLGEGGTDAVGRLFVAGRRAEPAVSSLLPGTAARDGVLASDDLPTAAGDEVSAGRDGQAMGRSALAERGGSAQSPSAAAVVASVRAVAEGYLAFARESPGLFAMACHDGADAVRALVAGRVGELPGLPPGAGLAVWSVVHGVALLVVDGSLRAVSVDEQRACLAQVMDIFLAGLGLGELSAVG